MFPNYRKSEQRADRCIHIVGLILGAAAFVVLVRIAAQHGQVLPGIGLILYGCALLGMLTCSALYNLTPPSPRKDYLRRLDHAAIFVMIAGTYTPFLLIRMQNATGTALLLSVWGAAAAGAFLKLVYPRRFERLSIAAYLLLGWLFLVAADEIFAALPSPAVLLLLAGGLVYTLGVVVHLCGGLPYHNAIWHALVLLAAACHYAAIVGYVAA